MLAPSDITLTDGFCGAGGSSEGARQAGIRVRVAMNHWRLAVETHNANHPDTDHDCADISQVDPRRYPTTTIAWWSPSCTNHTIARGRRRHIDATLDLFGETQPDQAAERSRATMWDVVRFTEYHRYRIVIVENVTDAREWILWPAWLSAMTALGYHFRTVWLNSMHATAAGPGAPQSRDRMYIIFWRAGDRAPDLNRWTRPTAHCTACDTTARAIQAWNNPSRTWGKYGQQYVWRCPTPRCHRRVHPTVRPATDIIDSTVPTPRIADRARPLVPKTMARIHTAYATLTTASPTPDLILPYYGNATPRPTTEPLPTVTTVDRHALLKANPSTSSVGDLRYRMLSPTEYAAAMAFPTTYHWQGTKRDRVRMAGNAVTPPASRDLFHAVTEALT